MSISDRLDQIAREAVEADEQWDCGRSAFNADNHAPPIDAALANGEHMLAALRAVLDACSTYEKTQAIYRIEMGQREIIRVVRAEISAALGEES